MRLEIGQPRDVPSSRVVGAHRQRVGIVEAQRHRDGEPHRRELGVELGQRRHAVELQDFLGDRAGVFGIDVDAAGRERVQHDGRVAQALAVRRARLAGGLRGLLEDLAEDVRLGEALGADIEGRRRERNRSAGERDEADNRAQVRIHLAPRGRVATDRQRRRNDPIVPKVCAPPPLLLRTVLVAALSNTPLLSW